VRNLTQIYIRSVLTDIISNHVQISNFGCTFCSLHLTKVS